MMIRQLLLFGILAVGALSGLVQGETLASLQSTATDTANTFSSQTVDIASSPSSAFITLSGMVPGETVTAPLTITNSGTMQLRYAISSTVTNADSKAIGAQLDLTIKHGVTTCTNAGFGATGTVIYGPDGPLGAIGSTLNLVGTPASFPNGGRTLAASANEVLCFQVSLPSGATTGQGVSTTATVDLIAEQTRNN